MIVVETSKKGGNKREDGLSSAFAQKLVISTKGRNPCRPFFLQDLSRRSK
jgi:hypothetical protein